MRASIIQVLISALALASAAVASPSNQQSTQRKTKHLRPVIKQRDAPLEPIVGTTGADILDGENEQIAFQNPDALMPPPTDAGNILVTDLPPSADFSGAQNHLKKGAIRQMHWHDINEWGYVTNGSVLVSVVHSSGQNQVFKANTGDIWYFPKGQGHIIQGLSPGGNEYLLVFDNGNFNAQGTTFNVDDWITHTPPSVLAKNFGVPNDTFQHTARPYGSIANGVVSNGTVSSPFGQLTGNSSYYFPASKMNFTKAPGGGGSYLTVDTEVFPIARNIAARIVEVLPGGLREMHWHPNGAEWLYFQSGSARATVWLGGANARTFDFTAGDTAVFPDNSGHYIENLSNTTSLFYLEIWKAGLAEDFSLMQWLALTPKDLVAQILNVSVAVVEGFKTEKQFIIKREGL
ncbi:hypothetical protein EG329_011899 [Mollisiaceae sp. DMI_Dod_QoI]|nr:hypothetical protein EG329_011899 [Helotiales sp. DMI_Dod_QoI]